MKSILSRIKNNRGETLIEVIVSAAIFAILVTGIISIFLTATRVNNTAYKINKADAKIGAEFDGTKPVAGVVTVDTQDTTAPVAPAPKFKLEFADGIADISADGTYEIGKSGEVKLPLKQFKPN